MKQECSRCDKKVNEKIPVMFCLDCVEEIRLHNIRAVFEDIETILLDRSDKVHFLSDLNKPSNPFVFISRTDLNISPSSPLGKPLWENHIR